MTDTIRLSSIFSSVQQSEFPYEVEEEFIVKNDGQKISVLITADNVPAEESYEMFEFLQFLEVDPEKVDNFGIASYSITEGCFIGFSPAYFAKNGEEFGLMIGVTNKNCDSSAIFIPCEVSEEEVKHGKRTVKKFVYTLNGVPVDLVELTDNEGKSLGKYYMKVYDIENDIAYSFPFLLDKNQETNVLEKFRKGEFSTILRDFNANRGNYKWISANKAFTDLFRSKTFPTGGIFMLCEKGQIRVTPAGSHPNIKSDISQSDWTIVATSHPEIFVNRIDTVTKQKEPILLSEATNIQFTSAISNNEGYTWLTNRGVTFHPGLVLIHIVRPSNKIENTPVNTLTSNPSLMVMKASKYAELKDVLTEKGIFQEAKNQILDSAKMGNMNSAPSHAIQRKVTRVAKTMNDYKNPAKAQPEVTGQDIMDTSYPVAGTEIVNKSEKPLFRINGEVDTDLNEFLDNNPI